MSTQSFRPGTRFQWNDAIFEFKRLLASGEAQIENILTEAYLTVAMTTLTHALFDNQLQFVLNGRNPATRARGIGNRAPQARGPLPGGNTRSIAPAEANTAGSPALILSSSSTEAPTTRPNYLTLDDCPPALLAIARRRLWVIQPLLDIPPQERTFAAVKARIAAVNAGVADPHAMLNTGAESQDLGASTTAHTPQVPTGAHSALDGGPHPEPFTVSKTSVYGWIRDYELSGGDIRALVPGTPRCGGRDGSRLAEPVNNIVEAVIRERYLVRERVTIDAVLHEVAVRVDEYNRTQPEAWQLRPPSRPTVGRRIEAYLLTESLHSYVARYGKPAAERLYNQYGQRTPPTVPLERAEIDHTISDFMVVDEKDNLPMGRLTFTNMTDSYSGYPLGHHLGFEPPSSRSVMDCLYNAICPKRGIRERYDTEHDWLSYGVPHSLVVDNARQFTGQDLKDACEQLGIQLYFAPVRTPHYKGMIERQFSSFNSMLFHTLPGTTFSNVGKRGDYDSVREACVCLNDVDRIIHKFLVDYYAERFHKGVRAVPARVWERAMAGGFLPNLPASLEELRIVLSRVAQRTITHYGIELWGLRYNCSALAPLRARLERKKDRSVKVKYNPGDISHVYVYDPFETEYIAVPALGREYTADLSLWKHRVILRVARSREDKPDIVALGRAKREIQRIVDAARNRTRGRRKTSTAMSRWITGGKHVAELGAATEAASPTDVVRTQAAGVAHEDAGERSAETGLPKECLTSAGVQQTPTTEAEPLSASAQAASEQNQSGVEFGALPRSGSNLP